MLRRCVQRFVPRARAYTDVPPDGGYGWCVVGAAFVVYLLSVGLQYCTGLFYKAWLQDLDFAGLSQAMLGWSTSVEATMFLAGSLIAGSMMMVTTPRVTVLVGSGCILIGALVAALAPPFPAASANLAVVVVFFGVVMGTGCSLAHMGAVVAVQSYFCAKRGIATGITVAGSGIGSFLLGPLFEFMIARHGWRVTLAAYGGFASALCAAAALVMAPVHITATPVEQHVPSKGDVEDAAAGRVTSPEDPADDALTGSSTHSGTSAAAPGRVLPSPRPVESSSPPVRPTYHSLFHVPFFTTYCAFVTFYALCWFSVPTFLPVTVTAQLGGTSVDAGAVVAVQGAANTVGRIALGLLVDRWPQNKLAILCSCMAVVAVASAVFAAVQSLHYAYVFAAILGGVGGSIVSIQPSIIIDALGMAALPLAQGAFNAVQAPFALAGPPIGGALKAHTGTYAATWAFIAAAVGCAWALALGIRRGVVDLRPCLRGRGPPARA